MKGDSDGSNAQDSFIQVRGYVGGGGAAEGRSEQEGRLLSAPIQMRRSVGSQCEGKSAATSARHRGSNVGP